MTGSSSPSSSGAGASAPVMAATTASSLPVTTRLGEFELTGVLGEGGFSVVYLASDHSLGRTVAIKEYMPSSIATRTPDGMVMPKSPKHEETFKVGLACFLEEARLLTRFTHPALVPIHRFWEQNGTAYMAMQYCVGQTLRQISQTKPEMARNEEWLKATFAPILDALELLHSGNCFHRDVSPENILILQTGAPVLIDFGAARQIIGDMTQALTVILKPGFAPIEQYADDTSLQQGPWTDVYGVGAVLYYLLMGKPPVASVARLVKDPMVRLADSDALASVSRVFREAIDRALAVYPDQRIRSIAELREALQLTTFRPNALLNSVVTAPAAPAVAQVTSEPTSAGHAGASAKLASNGTGAPASTQAAPLSKSSQVANTAAMPTGLFSAAMVALKHRFAGRRAIMSVAGLIVVTAGLAATVFGFLHPPSGKADAGAVSQDTDKNGPAQIPHMPPDAEALSQDADKNLSIPPPQVDPPAAPLISVTPASPPAAVLSVAHNNPENQASPPKTAASRPEQPSKTASSPVAVPVATKEQASPASALASAASAPPSSPSAEMVPAQTSVVRLSIRPWGQVSVDGQPKGISPPLNRLSLTPGVHQITITNGSLPPVSRTVTIPGNGEVVISHRFGVEE